MIRREDQVGRKVVVTGIGAVSPVGLNIPDMWDSLIRGRSGIELISTFDTSSFTTRIAAEVKNFDPCSYVNRKQARYMDRFTQFAVAASLQALESAKLQISEKDAEETGVIIGNSVCGLLSVCEQYEILKEKGPDKISPVLAPTMTGDASSVQVSIMLGAKGVNYAPSSACASGSDSIGQAFELIRAGRAQVMLAGGTEAPLMPVVLAAFCAIRALSTRNCDPHTACRPFDIERDGFVLGEGAAMIVMEDERHALERGAPILAEVLGYGASSDAFHLTQPSPGGEGAVRAVKMALKRADLSPDAIDYISAHGTATLLNDRVETTVLKNIFGERARHIPVSATKSITGHLLGAGGSLSAVITVLALNHGTVPPTINLNSPDPECDLDYVPNHCRKVEIKTAMANCFGFGGHNAVLIFQKYRH